MLVSFSLTKIVLVLFSLAKIMLVLFLLVKIVLVLFLLAKIVLVLFMLAKIIYIINTVSPSVCLFVCMSANSSETNEHTSSNITQMIDNMPGGAQKNFGDLMSKIKVTRDQKVNKGCIVSYTLPYGMRP